MPASYVERNVTRKMRIRISGDEEVLRNPLFAINWFDTRVALVYHFYNLLAAPRVYSKLAAKLCSKVRVSRNDLRKPRHATQVSVDRQLSIRESLSRPCL